MEKKYYKPQEMRPYRPIHPGEMIMDEIAYRGQTVEDFAKLIDCDKSQLQDIVNCKSPVTAEIALKVEAVTGIKAYIWVGHQEDYDFEMARKDKGLLATINNIRHMAASVLL